MTNFAPFLEALGVRLDHRPALTSDEYRRVSSDASPLAKAIVLARSAARALRSAREDHDLVLLHRLRLLTPLPRVDPPRRIDVFDFDDAIFLGSSSAVNHRFAWVKQEARRAEIAMRRARIVIAGNEVLARHARTRSSRVEIVPSCVDPTQQVLRDHRERATLTVGWIGSPTTSVYLEPLLPVFERLNHRGLGIRLVAVGANLPFAAPWFEAREWTLATEGNDLASFDIGVMPLPQTPWTRGKCGYKLLQYLSAGVPAVASPVGVSTQIVGDGRGILAESASEWERALLDLGADAIGRKERGAAGRAFVEREYSYQRWAPELAQILRSATH